MNEWVPIADIRIAHAMISAATKPYRWYPPTLSTPTGCVASAVRNTVYASTEIVSPPHQPKK